MCNRDERRRFCRRAWEAEMPITEPVLRREYNIPVAVAWATQISPQHFTPGSPIPRPGGGGNWKIKRAEGDGGFQWYGNGNGGRDAGGTFDGN